jgi:hypothetical protein
MEEFRKWKRITAWLSLTWLFALAGLSFTERLPPIAASLLLALVGIFLTLFFFANCNACFCRCSKCYQPLVNPAHFWFGTVIFANPKLCKGCGNNLQEPGN